MRRPRIVGFADWFTLRFSPEELLAETWSSSIATRVCDVCLDRLAGPTDDRLSWELLAATTAIGNLPELGELLAAITPLRDPSADEQAVYDVFHQGTKRPEAFGATGRILHATETRGDYAGAALLRETMRRLQKVFKVARRVEER
jgi:hypothetical protein